MLAPEEQQIEICLLKSNLEEVVDGLVVQRTACPDLDAEYERKSRETLAALKVVRSIKTEIERLKQENAHLTAKRLQLMRQAEEISTNLDRLRSYREEHVDLLKQEQHEIEFEIRKYEDSLKVKADRLRQTHRYYNEEEMNNELDKVNKVIAELKDELIKKQGAVDELRERMDAIHPEVPGSLLEIMGKQKLEEKVKLLIDKHDALVEKRKTIME